MVKKKTKSTEADLLRVGKMVEGLRSEKTISYTQQRLTDAVIRAENAEAEASILRAELTDIKNSSARELGLLHESVKSLAIEVNQLHAQTRPVSCCRECPMLHRHDTGRKCWCGLDGAIRFGVSRFYDSTVEPPEPAPEACPLRKGAYTIGLVE